MLYIIPIDYDRLNESTQTSIFSINNKQYYINIRKSSISNNCYITIKIDGETICDNKSCTCNEIITKGIVDTELYKEWIYFAYVTDDIEKDFDYNELGKTLMLFYWDRDESDLNV